MIEAIWTGEYPCFCRGEWKLKMDGENVSYMIPDECRHSPMGTKGTYRSWYFDDDYSEQFEDYVDGYNFECWVDHNPWVLDLPADALSIYLEFQLNDWRRGQCGGCI
jgi:hypothetical protein